MIEFCATIVEAWSEEYTDNYVVHQIFFEESDPNEGGESWCFSRSLGNADEEVCTVKEIQQVTLYKGIEHCQISSSQLVCRFEREAIAKTGTDEIRISYKLSDEPWQKLKQIAILVFQDQQFFNVTENGSNPLQSS